MIRFLREPTSRSYVLTYAAGQELCERMGRAATSSGSAAS